MWLKKSANSWKNVSVDFDDTIVEKAEFPAIGAEKPGAREAIERLRQAGWKIIIFSVRGNTPENLEIMKEWLDDNSFPYDEISAGEKPKALFYVDDRAVEFKNNWDEVVSHILGEKNV